MGLIICLAVICFVFWGMEDGIDSSAMDKVNQKLNNDSKEDPYQYWDMPF